MTHVELKNIKKSYGSFVALKDVTLTIDRGAFFTLLGPSGCGKTTLLRALAGLQPVSAGAVEGVAPGEVAFLFQENRLFPWRTAQQHVADVLPRERWGEIPYWLALVVAYWVLENPDRAGLGFAFVAGLLADVAQGAILGEQALRMVILAFILDRFRTRLRFFPVWQQALVMCGLLINDRIVAAIVHLLAGTPQADPMYWLSPLTGALMWGPMFAVLDALRHGRRRG